MKINNNFSLLPANYLFSEVAARIRSFKEENPGADVIRMDIGDVTRPLPEVCIAAMHKAVDELANAASFHGYGPEQGYASLREAIAEHDYRRRGLNICADEVFVSDGAKSDLGNLGDLLAPDAKVALCNPGYPVYSDSNVIDGRSGEPSGDGFSRFEYLLCTPENGFLPSLPTGDPDVIYLCFPNNPTGATLRRDQLKEWVDYAQAHKCLIIYDSAYEAYVTEGDVVRSVYEVEGAEKVAIEVRSFSKTAGFTGVRLGYTVVPRALKARFADGSEASLHDMWRRRQTTKFNGASYIAQKGAEALYTPEGERQIRERIEEYLANAGMLREAFLSMGYEVWGGVNSPYVWVRRPDAADCDSWEMFGEILRKAQVSTTPGSGFGSCGEGCLRLTGFASRQATEEAVRRLKRL